MTEELMNEIRTACAVLLYDERCQAVRELFERELYRQWEEYQKLMMGDS